MKNQKVDGSSGFDSLFSTDGLKSDFINHKIVDLVEREVELSEVLNYNGSGSVIKFIRI